MPIATSFTALGRGNGFPYCPTKVDVSVYDNWITLGGIEKGNTVTESKKSLSLVNAMKLYWNLYSATASFTSSLSKSSDDVNYSFTKDLSSSYIISPEPIERTCSSVSIDPTSVSKQFTEAELTQTDGASCGGNAVFSVPAIKRMYDGDINDESKFVGYGIESLYSALTSFAHNEGILNGSATIQIGSYLDGESDSGSTESPVGSGNINYFDKTASSVSIGGIQFKSFASASVSTNASSNLSKTVTSSASSASASGSWTAGSSTSSGSGGVSAPSIDFYTY